MSIAVAPFEQRVTEPLSTIPAICCLCGVEDAIPVAVGRDFEYQTCPDEFLAVRCRRCRIVYLHDRPATSDATRIYPDNYHAFQFLSAKFGLVHRIRQRLESRKLRRWCHGLPNNARILDVGCGDGFHLDTLRLIAKPGWQLEGIDHDERAVAAAKARGLSVRKIDLDDLPHSDRYDLILLIMTIEHVDDPLGLLQSIADRLRSGGRLVIVTDNTRTPDFAIFGGRHWGGYHFPRHTYLFDKASLAALGEKAGFEIESVRSVASPVNWTYSVRNWLDDWGAPKWIVNRFTLSSPLALGVFTIIDTLCSLFGRGGNLHAHFRKGEPRHDA